MEKIIYRRARLDEYHKIGKVVADSFSEYPFLMLVNYNSKINCFDDQVPSFYKNITKFSKLKDC